jgi:UDP-N-acetylglucosamine 2-epimerase (non-hydrolysing)
MTSTNLIVPCLTLRPNTELPITCSVLTNTLVPFDLSVIKNLVESIENENYKKGKIPLLWDGNATKRILKILLNTNLKVN